MQSLTFKEKSWHAWVVDHFTPSYAVNFNNLCSYFWIVMFGLFVLTLVSLFALAVILGLTFDVAWIFGHVTFIDPKSKTWESLSHFRHVWQVCAILANVCLGIIAFIRVIIGVCWLLDKRVKKTRYAIAKEPGFFKASFLTFKDKVCFKIKFEE